MAPERGDGELTDGPGQGRAVGGVFTWYGFPEEWELYLGSLYELLLCDYVIGGLEVCPTTGRQHIQGAFHLLRRTGWSKIKEALVAVGMDSDWQWMRGPCTASQVYCSKDGRFVEFGECPVGAGQREKINWDDALENARQGRFDLIPSRLIYSMRGREKELRMEHLESQVPRRIDGRFEHLWLTGVPDSGKSHYARSMWPELYEKSTSTKWWDRHNFAETVLLDDLDGSHLKDIGTYFKTWFDCYRFSGESKGTVHFMRPKRFIVTSNYKIRDLFGKDPILCDAMEKRFTQYEFTDPRVIPEGLEPPPDMIVPDWVVARFERGVARRAELMAGPVRVGPDFF